VPLAAEPPAAELPPAEPPEDPPLCASANVLESAKAVASAIVRSFIGRLSLEQDQRQSLKAVPKKPALARSRSVIVELR
jgi:hypothetical protein